MKPGQRAQWREEPSWFWWENDPPPLGLNPTAHALSGNEQPPRDAAANLWVPDIEQRHGWREYYVYRDPPPPPPGRKLGL